MKMATGDRHKSTFNKTQQVVLDTILAGHNVVVLGKARTGKTFLLRRIIELLKPSKRLKSQVRQGYRHCYSNRPKRCILCQLTATWIMKRDIFKVEKNRQSVGSMGKEAQE